MLLKYIERKHGALTRTFDEEGPYLALWEFHRNQHLRLFECPCVSLKLRLNVSPLILRLESFLQFVGMSDGFWRWRVAQPKCYLALGYTRSK